MSIRDKIKNMSREDKLNARLKLDKVVGLVSLAGAVTLGTIACFAQNPDVGLGLSVGGMACTVPALICVGDSFTAFLEQEQIEKRAEEIRAKKMIERNRLNKLNEIDEYFSGKKFDGLEK